MGFITSAALLRRWLLLPASIGLVAGSAALWTANQLTPVYRATATVMIQPAATTGPAGFLTLDQLARTYAQLLTRRPLLEQVIADLGLTTDPARLTTEISIVPERDTSLLDVQVDDPNPAQGAAIANTLVKDFIGQAQAQQAALVDTNLRGLQGRIDELQAQITTTAQSIARLQAMPNPTPDQRAQLSLLQQTQSAQSASYASLVREYEDARTAQLRQYDTLTLVDPATEPTRALMPSPTFDALLAMFAGILAGIGLAWLAQRLDTTFRSPDEIRRALRVPLLGSLPNLPGRQAALIVLREPASAAGEAFRILRNTILFAAAGQSKTLAITSSVAREGKTRTAANLAAVFAQAGHRTILVDADLRRPGLHQLFHMSERPGLTDALVAGEVGPGVVRDTAVPGLRLVPSGTAIDNSSEALGAPIFKDLLNQLAADADFVIVDTAPVNGIADATVVARSAEMTLLVVEAGSTSRRSVDDALATLETAGASVAGAVLNRSTDRAETYYGQAARREPIPLRVQDGRAVA